MSPHGGPARFAGFVPYRPPWFPAELGDPWAVVAVGGITAYEKWVDGLADGELVRLIAEHRAKAAGS
jgi:hypothetical protein